MIWGVRTTLLFALTFLCWADSVPLDEYAGRRARLLDKLPDSVIVLFAHTPSGELHDRNGYFQEPNFYYLTGLQQSGAALLLCSSCPAELRQILFLPKRNARREIYDGPALAPGDAAIPARTGFTHSAPIESLETHLASALSHAINFYTLFDGKQDALARLAPLRTLRDVRPTLTSLRLVKSAHELALLDKAIAASIEAHLASWRATRPGVHEYEIAALMQQTYFARGCERNAYAPIVASGPNSVILHYTQNRRRMDSGDILLLDVGGEYSMYAADITRSIPVNGKFTPRQREIYQLVLGAQAAVLKAARPGILLADLTKAAREYLNSQGKGPNGKPWGEYLPHGVSHHIGLEVHDPHDPALPLAEGNVITIEPGLYLPEENLGIRIEDMIVLTRDGHRNLTQALPKDIPTIERRMAP
jgi:Xaa-Pro aminopeptidase